MINKLTLYYFDPLYSAYSLRDETCKHLALTQKIYPIINQTVNEIKQLDGKSKTSLAFSHAVVVLIGAGLGILSKQFYNLIVDEQENKDVSLFSQWALSMVMSSMMFYGITSKRLFQHFEYSVCLFSQDSQYHIIMPCFLEAFIELKKEQGCLVDLWYKIKDFKSEKEMHEFLKKQLEKGVCFGYVMAILEQLANGKELHGDELLKNINIKTVIKKQLLRHFYITFNNLLEEKDEIIGGKDHFNIVKLNTSENIQLSNGTEERRYTIQHAVKEAYKLSYLTKGAFKINIASASIKVAKGPDAIQRNFLDQMHRDSFINFDQIDPRKPFKSIYDCFETQDFMTEESLTSKPIATDQTICINLEYFNQEHQAKKAKAAFVKKHLVPLPQEAIIAGRIALEGKWNGDRSMHALYFRLSNRKYHLFDPSESFYELPSFAMFFDKLYNCVKDGYGLDTKITFNILAIQSV